MLRPSDTRNLEYFAYQEEASHGDSTWGMRDKFKFYQ